MSFFDDIREFGSAIGDAASSTLDLYKSFQSAELGYQSAQLNQQMSLAQINAMKTKSQTDAQIAQIQAQSQLAQAQTMSRFWTGLNGTDQSMANIQTMFGRATQGNNLMMWLTVAGLVLAAMQYMKK